MTATRIRFSAPRIAELEVFDVCEPHGDEVSVRTHYSAVSGGTERACLVGEPNTPAEYPKYMGYSSVGIVTAVGRDVPHNKVAVGDRVLVYHGRHASRNIISFRAVTVVADTSIESADAAFVIIASMGLGGVRKLELEIGESAMVMGLGLLGLFSVQFCRWSGAHPVIAADPDERRRTLALSLGADHAFDPLAPDFAEKVRSVTGGRGVNATVEVTGTSSAMTTALACAARQGRISLLGCTRISDCPVDYYQEVHRPGVKLIGAHNHVRPQFESYPHHWTHQDDCAAVLRLIASGRIAVAPVISEIVPPADAPAIYTRLADGGLPAGVLFDWTGPEVCLS